MAAALIGGVVLAGWVLDIGILKNISPALGSMKANTALGLVLCGTALTALSGKTHRTAVRVALTAISIIAAIVGLLSIGEQLFGWNLGIDQLLIHDSGVMDGGRQPGRMSPATGFCLVLTGIALVRKTLSSSKTPSPFIMALGVVVATAGSLALIGYMSDAALGHTSSNYTGMAIQSAIGFICLGCGLVSLGRGDEKWSWALGSLGTAGFIGGTLLMLAVQGMAFKSAKQMEAATGWVDHTLSVLKEIRDVRMALAGLESGQRGYLITGDEHFLASRNEIGKNLDDHLKIVRTLTADNPDQQATLKQVEVAARRRTLFEDRAISISHVQGPSTGRQLAASEQGVVLSAELESVLKQMSDREDDLLTHREIRSRDASTTTFLLLPLGAFVSLTTLVAGLFLLNSSIHDKRRSDQATHSQLEAIFEAVADGIAVFDMIGNIILANESQALLIGFATAAEMKRNITYFTEQYELSYPDGTLVPFHQWPPMKVLRGESVVDWELRVRHKDIEREWFFSYSGQPVHNERGERVLAVITTHDITERKNAEESLRKSVKEAQGFNSELSFYKFALDQAAIVAVTDAAGTITFVNDKFCEISGYSREELLGKNHRLVNSQHHPKSFFVNMYSTIARGQVWHGEIRNRAKDGHFYWVDTTIIPMQDNDGRVTRYVAIRADITARIESEEKIIRWNAELEHRIADRTAELAETNSDLEAFTYSVSHDLRAPLRAIDGFSRILETEYATSLPDEAKRFLDLVRNNVQQMGQLVEDLLALCRHGRQSIVAHKVQPDNVVQQAWKDLTQWPSERAMTFDLQPLGECRADPGLLKQVFINLLSNAMKFTRTREKALITVGSRKDDAGEVVYFVKDNGIGFEMQYVHKLFGVFQRLHRAEDYEGTGVGLAIVQRIIKKHGGRVWAESEPDKGTTISFTLGSDN